jgi:serine/threonine-protein kinase
MGVVYRARHTFLRRPTAVKVVADKDPDTLDRFEREVQATAQLTHPNTIAVFDFGRRADGALYYAMEYLDGIDLELLVRKYGPQPADRVVSILAQVCGALHEAHGMGLLHRDIKPANIILCERGAVPDVAKVVDFGLVTEITANDGKSSRAIMGTAAYLAPEAVTDPERVGFPADIYALGAVGYFLLTGRNVFEGATSVDICLKHVNTPPIPPSKAAAIHIPDALERVLLACLAKQPEERPSADDLAKQLRALAATGDWSEAEALRWWGEFHAFEEPAAPAKADDEMTITVDLGRRGLPTPPPRPRARTARPSAPPRPEGKRASRVKRPSTAA